MDGGWLFPVAGFAAMAEGAGVLAASKAWVVVVANPALD